MSGDAASGTIGSPPKLASEVTVDGLRWRSFRFGSANHLFGVVTEPEAGAKRDLPAVLLLTGGVTPRTSGNQSYVTLARRLGLPSARVPARREPDAPARPLANHVHGLSDLCDSRA